MEKALGRERYNETSPLVVGKLDIDPFKKTEDGELSKYAQEGRPVVTAGAEMLADVQVALKKIAKEMQGHTEPLSHVDYIMGISRLGSVAGYFGFDTYALPDTPERQNHPSYKHAEEANIQAGMDPEKAQKKARQKPITLAVISKKKLLELYGQ